MWSMYNAATMESDHSVKHGASASASQGRRLAHHVWSGRGPIPAALYSFAVELVRTRAIESEADDLTVTSVAIFLRFARCDSLGP